MYPVPIGSGLGEIRGLIFLTRGSTEARLRDTFHGTMGSIERWQDSGGSKMTAIMSIHEPRPRGTAHIGMRRHGTGCASGDGDGGFRTDRPVRDQQGACACIEKRSGEAGECL